MRILYLIALFTLFSCSKPQKEEAKKSSELEDTLKKEVKLEMEAVDLDTIDYSLIVVDTSTHLVWMKEDFSFLENRFLKNWDEIFQWQDKMNAMKYAGYEDWRVPNIKEYRSVNKNKKDREIYRKKFIEVDSNFFWGKGAYAFWSSTSPGKYTASYISFKKGFAVSGDKEKQTTYRKGKNVEFGMSVRLVR